MNLLYGESFLRVSGEVKCTSILKGVVTLDLSDPELNWCVDL
jgi:hypothetical protein